MSVDGGEGQGRRSPVVISAIPGPEQVVFIVNVLEATDGTAEITTGERRPWPSPPSTDIVPGVPH